jgi:hypothetical protein
MFHTTRGAMEVDTEWKNPAMPRFAVTWKPDRDGVAEGAVDFLALTQEDAAPHGLHRPEQADLQRRIDGKRLQFRVSPTSHGFTNDAAGSWFAGTFGGATSHVVQVDVAADRLAFIRPSPSACKRAVD